MKSGTSASEGPEKEMSSTSPPIAGGGSPMMQQQQQQQQEEEPGADASAGKKVRIRKNDVVHLVEGAPNEKPLPWRAVETPEMILLTHPGNQVFNLLCLQQAANFSSAGSDRVAAADAVVDEVRSRGAKFVSVHGRVRSTLPSEGTEMSRDEAREVALRCLNDVPPESCRPIPTLGEDGNFSPGGADRSCSSSRASSAYSSDAETSANNNCTPMNSPLRPSAAASASASKVTWASSVAQDDGNGGTPIHQQHHHQQQQQQQQQHNSHQQQQQHGILNKDGGTTPSKSPDAPRTPTAATGAGGGAGRLVNYGCRLDEDNNYHVLFVGSTVNIRSSDIVIASEDSKRVNAILNNHPGTRAYRNALAAYAGRIRSGNGGSSSTGKSNMNSNSNSTTPGGDGRSAGRPMSSPNKNDISSINNGGGGGGGDRKKPAALAAAAASSPPFDGMYGDDGEDASGSLALQLVGEMSDEGRSFLCVGHFGNFFPSQGRVMSRSDAVRKVKSDLKAIMRGSGGAGAQASPSKDNTPRSDAADASPVSADYSAPTTRLKDPPSYSLDDAAAHAPVAGLKAPPSYSLQNGAPGPNSAAAQGFLSTSHPMPMRLQQQQPKRRRRKRKISEQDIEAAIPQNASSVFHVFDRRVNLDAHGQGASVYSLLRSWVQDDPHRKVPAQGVADVVEYCEHGGGGDWDGDGPVRASEKITESSTDPPPSATSPKEQKATETCDVFSQLGVPGGTAEPTRSADELRADLVKRAKRVKRRKVANFKRRDAEALAMLKQRGIHLPNC